MSNPDLLSLTKAQVFATPKKERLAMTNYDEAKVSPYTLPELLRMTDGRMVTDKEMWQERRKEILDILQKNIYGKIIPAPDHLPVHFREAPTKVIQATEASSAICPHFSPSGEPYLPSERLRSVNWGGLG